MLDTESHPSHWTIMFNFENKPVQHILQMPCSAEERWTPKGPITFTKLSGDYQVAVCGHKPRLACEKAKWLEALDVKPEGLVSIPGIHMA